MATGSDRFPYNLDQNANDETFIGKKTFQDLKVNSLEYQVQTHFGVSGSYTVDSNQAVIHRLHPNAALTVTNITNPSSGQIVILFKVAGSAITVQHGSGLVLLTGVDTTLNLNDAMTFFYDGTSGFWRQMRMT